MKARIHAPDDMLDAIVACELSRRIPADVPAFQREVSLFFTMQDLPPDTKFMELPGEIQALIALRAGVSLAPPVN